MTLLIALLVCFLGAGYSSPVREAPSASTCGYDSCPVGKPGMINVHLVCHTHDDVGWLKTIDEYYYGDKNNIQNAGVQYILDSVIDELLKDPQRRFIYVETSFFYKWWISRDESVHAQVQQLVQSGQLEFIGGGWCMNDEAGNYYADTIDQMTWGLRFLNDTFGPCGVPKIAWQIDPFGHSREQASISAQMGFEGIFFGRIDHIDKDNRETQKTMEMVWHASENLGSDADIFTGVLPNQYQAPSGFNFDILSNDEPIRVICFFISIDIGEFEPTNVNETITVTRNSAGGSECEGLPYAKHGIPMPFRAVSAVSRYRYRYRFVNDNPALKGYNVDRRVNDFVNIVRNEAEHYLTNDLIMTMGGDFNYQDARTWYINLDKVIKYVNELQANGSNINVFYSTPSCYLKALNNAGITWPVKSDDFFPYSSDYHSYWTGYFTSRAALKGYLKVTNNVLQIAKQVSSYANLGVDNDVNNLAVLKRFQGDMQHHDAVAGTAKQAVSYDYAESLAIGVDASVQSINNAYNKLLSISTTSLPTQEYCSYLNVSYCDATEGRPSFVVNAYNPLGHTIKSHIRVPISNSETSSYTVTGPSGEAVESQVVPLPQEIIDTPEKQGSATSDLVFGVTLPPSGLNSYFIQASPLAQSKQLKSRLSQAAPKAGDLVITNEVLSVTVSGDTGLLSSITDLTSGKVYNVKQNFYYYLGMNGDNSNEDYRASGAYIFRPNGTNVYPVGSTVTATLITGNTVQEIQQTFGNYVSQVIRLYPGESGVEFEWLVGPIPVDDNFGKEVISRFETDFVTNGVFYTDSNGREILERKRSYRPSWNFVSSESIAENYYPVNSRIYIQDSAQDAQLTVATDRSQGGSSILDGSIELMVHRRLLHDDAFGVGEPLNEPGVDGKGLVVRGKHRVIVSTISAAAPIHRNVGLEISYPPFVTVSTFSGIIEDYQANFRTTYSSLTAALPDNVNLLTVEPWQDGNLLLRLEHFFEQNDDPTGLSQPVTVNIQNLFTNFEIVEAIETTLGANVLLADSHRLSWNVTSTSNTPKKQIGLGAEFDVTLNPMQIRTFILKVTYN